MLVSLAAMLALGTSVASDNPAAQQALIAGIHRWDLRAAAHTIGPLIDEPHAAWRLDAALFLLRELPRKYWNERGWQTVLAAAGRALEQERGEDYGFSPKTAGPGTCGNGSLDQLSKGRKISAASEAAEKARLRRRARELWRARQKLFNADHGSGRQSRE